MWVRDGGCRKVIESVWDSSQANPNECFTDKIIKCQAQLRLWNQMIVGNVNTRLKQLKERLQLIEGQNLLHNTANEIQALKKEINKSLVREEVMWNQRSRALWLKCGDRNTRFFHTTMTQRQRRNRIEGLMDEGVWHDSKEDLERVILKYFLSIYSTDHPTSFDASLNAVTLRVSQEMNGELMGTFREEEIRAALNQMHPTKAPGPDGLSPIFFQKY